MTGHIDRRLARAGIVLLAALEITGFVVLGIRLASTDADRTSNGFTDPVAVAQDEGWDPVEHCRSGPSNRPALLLVVFEGATFDFEGRVPGWTFKEAHEAFEALRLPTEQLERVARTEPDALEPPDPSLAFEREQVAVRVPGVVGDLVPAARRIAAMIAPRPAPHVQIACEGLVSLVGSLSLRTGPETPVREVIERLGSVEELTDRHTYRILPGRPTYWTLRTDATWVVRRAILYLEQPEIPYLDLHANCGGTFEGTLQPGCGRSY